MGRQIIWSPEARSEMREICDYWVSRNQSNRYSVLLQTEVDSALIRLSQQPYVGNQTEIATVHRKLVRDYYIFYEIRDQILHVLSVWDTRRNPDYAPFSY